MKANNKTATQSISIKKARSARSNLSLSYILFLSNTWSFTRSLLPSTLCMGIVITIAILIGRFFSISQSAIIWIISGILVTYFYSTFILGFKFLMKKKFDTETSLLTPLRNKSEFKHIFGSSSLAVFYLTFITIIIAALLFIAGSILKNINIFLIIPIIIIGIIIIVPLALANFSITTDEVTDLKQALCFGFRYAKRYFGSTLLILFITTIIALFFGIIGSLPTLILQWAISASDEAIAVGDPSDLPSYVHALSFVFIIFAVAFATIATLPGWIAGFLHCHSIRAKELKRLEQQNKQ